MKGPSPRRQQRRRSRILPTHRMKQVCDADLTTGSASGQWGRRSPSGVKMRRAMDMHARFHSHRSSAVHVDRRRGRSPLAASPDRTAARQTGAPRGASRQWRPADDNKLYVACDFYYCGEVSATGGIDDATLGPGDRQRVGVGTVSGCTDRAECATRMTAGANSR